MKQPKHYKLSKLLFIFLLGIGFSIPSGTVMANDFFERSRQTKPLIEILEEVTSRYQVFFSYEASLMEEVNVDFEFKEEESLDQAITRIDV